ncbi:hypothetical protein FJV41_33730 [Myxococcus llanfairpwllgwyngyllgogerychwyrndrobwllllantysiliogogogochensis]|uniref:Uncharacterized protein n=1 Tax=Myxococcus llanfairpwllgwyngyllgogerychwyrndrobwllllantysiliogogogochensis TaxID=2590453 RepID=A0A540WRI8_9BACT|nr:MULTISPECIES: hypothetical protein [Myxococcus]NTX39404.1 hypothetical protein [Myxococcus sp. CA033]NTX55478.1 hypothetical protein [Myxococcus sp. CA039A]TQF11527.1 hypothetical protein FJV41_33730 [Myxococcus llanfairpwllgwyngyllgogerychwyrndrobwllllantysiliogogogochensis]
MRSLLVLGLTVLGFQFGCGAGEADPGMQSDLTSREDSLVRCIADYYITYYSDATYTTAVGSERCTCNRTPTRTGVQTDFAVENYYEECL